MLTGYNNIVVVLIYTMKFKSSRGANAPRDSLFLIFDACKNYNAYSELTQKVLSGAVDQAYSYAYKDNAAHNLEYVGMGNYKFYPLTDVNGRNTGREIYSGENKLAAEYITYRKVGDHATNMPASIWFGTGKNIKDSIKYKYDSCGNICEITQNGHLVARYKYDSLNRLVREDNKPMNKTVIFTYNTAGNITERCEYAFTSREGEELTELACTHYSYDYEGDRLVNYNGESVAYNVLGNPTSYRGNAIEWQYGNRLTKFGTTTFAYDGAGRRVGKGNIAFTYDSDGRLLKQSNGLEFIYDNSGVIGLKYGENTYFYRRDCQGNIIAILDSAGAVVVEYKYDAWGNHEAEVASEDYVTLAEINPFRYRGYYFDEETGLYYLQTRYYDPEVGRFISRDSIEYADPETICGLNLYAYCGNNPVMNVDPMGNAWWDWLAGVLAVVGIALVAGAIAVLTAGIGTAIMVGTMAGAVLHGAAVGALVGAGIGMVAGGIIGGAVTGWSVNGILAGIGIGLGAGAIIGAIVGGAAGGFHYAWQQSVLSKASSFSSGGKTELHHIVEQCQQAKSGFAKELIKNARNEIRIDKVLHGKISGYYSSIYRNSGMRFRDFLATKHYSFGKQYNIGIRIISNLLKML